MPFGPGTYGGGGAGLAGPAVARQGIPEGVMPTAAPTEEALSEIMQMLRGGQAGADRFLELLSLLAASAAPQMDQDPAMMRTQQQQGGQQQMMQGGQGGGGASIAALLGG